MLTFLTFALRVPVAGLAKELTERILCAVSLGGECGPPGLDDIYGEEIAVLLREYSPGLIYETGMSALPVDFRRCRLTACSSGLGAGERQRSRTGEPVSAFVHVIDCREDQPPGVDCSGKRAGNLYLEYFFYYPESNTMRAVLRGLGHHDDDWESWGVRIGPDGEADVRASSHHGYNYELGMDNWGSDAAIGPLRDLAEAVGARPKGGWGPDTGWLFVSGGSHAGNARGDLRRIGSFTTPDNVELIPLEPIAARDERTPYEEHIPYGFAIDPPWRKDVWSDPEAEGTD